MEDTYTGSGLSPAFAAALVKAQGQIEGAKKGSLNPAFRTKYADLGAVWDACTDALQSNDLAVLQFPCKAKDGHVGLKTIVVYGPTGESISEEFEVPVKDAHNPQAMGSAITYARRYSLSAVLGVRVTDDDGNQAAGNKSAGPQGRQPHQQAQPKAAAGQPQGNGAWYRTKFDASDGVPGRKAVYTELKNSSVSEPEKTALLTAFATEIKGLQAKEGK